MLDSVSVSVCSLCIVAGSRGPAGVCWCAVMDSASVSVGSLCIFAGSRGSAGVC